jgi:hypothetical protein
MYLIRQVFWEMKRTDGQTKTSSLFSIHAVTANSEQGNFEGNTQKKKITFFSRVPIIRPSVIRHSVLSDVPCRNANSHSDGLNSIETALAYVGQTTKGGDRYRRTTAQVTLPQRKGRRLRSKYPLLISSKNKLFHLQICIVLNTIFVCEIFSFDAAVVFSS